MRDEDKYIILDCMGMSLEEDMKGSQSSSSSFMVVHHHHHYLQHHCIRCAQLPHTEQDD